MASPKVLVQILVTGSRILGKAFFEAGRQAVKNAKQSPQAAMGGDVAGVGHATSGSVTDNLTRDHRMTVDEAQLILNVKRDENMENILKNYELLFKANSPPAPPPKTEKPPAGKPPAPPAYSHYLQSKVVRARDRLEAEFKAAAAEDAQPPQPPQPPPPTQPGTQPPPPPNGNSSSQS